MSNANNNANLLIVDDLSDNLLALQAVIRGPGHTIFQASSGEQALALLLEHEFALAILDVQMPGMNGFELAELMRGTEKTRHIPIVFVTAAGKESNYSFKGYESGAVDFLYKPLDIDAVKGKVNVFVELYLQRSEIRRQVAALEKSQQEQAALVQQLQASQGELHKAVRMRDNFMSVVAHELLTPLHNLFLQTQLRKIELDSNHPDMFQKSGLEEMFGRDQQQIQSMVTLIDDMLDVSRIRQNRLTVRPRPAELSSLVKRAVAQVEIQAAAAGTAIRVEADSAIAGCWDEFRIQQVIVNLLNNAIRYGEGKSVTISLNAVPQGACIKVRDQGKGIAATDQKRIFQQFERGEDSAEPCGFGLGLYISQQLLEAHGGTIELVSEVAKGTVFTVFLPLTPPADMPVDSVSAPNLVAA